VAVFELPDDSNEVLECAKRRREPIDIMPLSEVDEGRGT
jgi:hypothetical protein